MRTQKADYREIERFPLVNRPSLKEVAETILKAPQKRGTVWRKEPPDSSGGTQTQTKETRGHHRRTRTVAVETTSRNKRERKEERKEAGRRRQNASPETYARARSEHCPEVAPKNRGEVAPKAEARRGPEASELWRECGRDQDPQYGERIKNCGRIWYKEGGSSYAETVGKAVVPVGSAMKYLRLILDSRWTRSLRDHFRDHFRLLPEGLVNGRGTDPYNGQGDRKRGAAVYTSPISYYMRIWEQTNKTESYNNKGHGKAPTSPCVEGYPRVSNESQLWS